MEYCWITLSHESDCVVIRLLFNYRNRELPNTVILSYTHYALFKTSSVLLLYILLYIDIIFVIITKNMFADHRFFFTQLAYTEHVYKKYIQIIHHRTCGALWPHHVTMLTFSQFYSKYSPFAGTHFSCLLTHLKYIWENQSWESSISFLNRTFKVC